MYSALLWRVSLYAMGQIKYTQSMKTPCYTMAKQIHLMMQQIRSLEKKGLVEHVNLPDDRRTFSIMPTKSGAKLADDALGKVIEVHTKFFAPLRQDTNQYLALTQKLIEENNDD
jgi:hypothetical protein